MLMVFCPITPGLSSTNTFTKKIERSGPSEIRSSPMKGIGKTLLLILFPLLCADMAQAVSLSNDGTGDVLIYPFYSVESGNDTYVSLVNQSDQAKAVRVRFRESMENHPVLSFNLYLAPQDHWAGAVTTDAGGGARLISADASCTYPDIPPQGLLFSDAAYAGINGELQGLARTGEGLVEVIEMGVVDGSVQDCAAIQSAWSEGGAWVQNPAHNILSTTGGLSGYGVIVNVNEGTNITYSATALKDFFENKSMHRHPETAAPTLADADPVIFYNGRVVVSSGIDAVNLVLMKRRVDNEFVIDESIAAATDLVFTLPTKNLYEKTPDGFIGNWDIDRFDTDIFYIPESLEPYNTNHIGTYDFGIRPPGVCFVSCRPPRMQVVSVGIDGAVNIVPIAQESVLYPSSRSTKEIVVDQYGVVDGIATYFLESYRLKDHSGYEHLTSGYVSVMIKASDYCTYDDLNNITFYSGRSPVTACGLPVLSFSVQKYVNGNVNGLLSNYSVVTESTYQGGVAQ
jgi:hypothetical protein